MLQYAETYKIYEIKNKELEKKHADEIAGIQETISSLKQQIQEIDSSIAHYKNSIRLVTENYDELISEYENKIISLEEQIAESDKHIGEWNDMNELFSKTLRYGLLDTLIPHINKSIKYYMTKLDQDYTVKYDQEFKPHIYINNNDNEISYKDLSTGQRKTLDIAIIFGVIQNVIANVDFNIFFLDELFSNMDSDSRNTMLTLLKETLSENRTIFVVNHSEMSDDFFNHKIRVHLNSKRIIDAKKKEEVNVKASKYEKIF
jgi:DNA repair exonuclease SbcCD ATPase subunit